MIVIITNASGVNIVRSVLKTNPKAIAKNRQTNSSGF